MKLYLSIHLAICLSISLSSHLAICLSIYLYLPSYLYSVCPSAHVLSTYAHTNKRTTKPTNKTNTQTTEHPNKATHKPASKLTYMHTYTHMCIHTYTHASIDIPTYIHFLSLALDESGEVYCLPVYPDSEHIGSESTLTQVQTITRTQDTSMFAVKLLWHRGALPPLQGRFGSAHLPAPTTIYYPREFRCIQKVAHLDNCTIFTAKNAQHASDEGTTARLCVSHRRMHTQTLHPLPEHCTLPFPTVHLHWFQQKRFVITSRRIG